MRKILKIIGIVAGILILLLVAAAIVLPMVVNPNDFKPRIQAAVEDTTGRKLEIPGDISLSVFPWLGAKLGVVRLGNADGFGDAPFLAVKSAQVRVKLLPLLKSEVQVGRVVLEEPVIRLGRNEQGVSNWDDLAGGGKPAASEESTSGEAPRFSVDGIEIRNASVSYKDAQAGLDAELSNFMLEAGEVGLPADFPAKMSGRLRVNEPELVAEFSFEGQVSADPEHEAYGVSNGKLQLKASGKGLPVTPLALDAKWQQLTAQLADNAANVDGLVLDTLDSQLRVTAKVTGLDGAPNGEGALEFSSKDLAAVQKALAGMLPPQLRLAGPASTRLQFTIDQASGQASLKQATLQAMGADVNLDAEVANFNVAPRANGKLALKAEDLAVVARQLGEWLPKGLALSGPASADFGFSYDQSKGTASLQDARLHGAGAVVELAAKAAGLPDDAQAAGTLAVNVEDLAVLLRQLGSLAPPDLPLSGKASLAAGFDYDQTAGRAEIHDIKAEALNVTASANISARALDSAPAFKGKLQLDEFSPGKLLVRLGQELPATQDGNVLEKAKLSAEFDVAPNSAVFDKLDMTLDQTRINGRVSVPDINKQSLRFDLAVDGIDVDRYLPPPVENSDKTEEASPLDEIEIPADLVRGRDVTGNISIGKLKAFDFRSHDVKVGVAVQKGVLRVHPLEARFYDGGYRGDITLDASAKIPVVSVDEHLERVQLAPLVKDVFDVENISGSAKLNVKAKARGKKLGDLRRTLDGTFDADVADGAIEGFNLWESIREAYAKIKGQPYDRGDAPNRTKFAALSASGTIEKGILHNDDLLAKLPFITVTGKGDINIVAATLDYTVDAKVLKSPELKGGVEELAGSTIPVRLTGPLMDPKVRPDVQGVLEAKAKEALKKKEQELRDEAKRKADEERKKLEDKLKDKLKGLIG